MADTMQSLQFRKVASMPASGLTVGAIYFDKSTGTINVATAADSYDKFGWGVKDAVWANQKLTLTKSNGETVELDFTNVASASDLTALAGRVGNLETWQTTTDAKLAGLTGTVAEDIAAAVKVEKERAEAAEKALGDRVTPLETASEQYSKDIADLKTAVGEGGSVETQIVAKINELDSTVGSQTVAEGKHIAVEVVETDGKLTGLTVTENFTDITTAISDEVERATNAEEAINKKIGTPTGVADVAEYSETYTVATDIKAAKDAAAAAQKTIDDFLTGEGVDPNKVDALKEIIAYMEEHGEDYQAVVDNLDILNTDVATLKGDATTVGSVAKAAADAQAAAEATAAKYADDLIAAEVERADGKYEEKGVAADLVNGLAEGAVAANATAITGLQEQVGTGTVDDRIATAKNEAVTAAQDLVDGLAEGAVADNTAAIEALDAKVTEGLSWAKFE